MQRLKEPIAFADLIRSLGRRWIWTKEITWRGYGWKSSCIIRRREIVATGCHVRSQRLWFVGSHWNVVVHKVVLDCWRRWLVFWRPSGTVADRIPHRVAKGQVSWHHHMVDLSGELMAFHAKFSVEKTVTTGAKAQICTRHQFQFSLLTVVVNLWYQSKGFWWMITNGQSFLNFNLVFAIFWGFQTNQI